MANWLRKLMPKEDRYFPLFDDLARAIDEAAHALKTTISAGPASAGVLDRFVAEGRDRTRAILDRLRSSFVTPFDRSDVKRMTTAMQAVLVDMQAVAGQRGGDDLPELERFGDAIVACAEDLRRGVAQLGDLDRHADDLRKMRERIGETAARVAQWRDEAVRGCLERGGAEPLDALRRVRLIERVAAVVEHFDRVADFIDDLVLDHV